MDQVSTVPRSGAARERPPAALRATPLHPVDPSGGDPSESSADDPDSPGSTSPFSAGRRPAEGLSDPLAEPVAAVLGSTLALLTLLVPLLTVVTDRRDLPLAPQARSAEAPMLSRSGRVEAIPGGAGSLLP